MLAGCCGSRHGRGSLNAQGARLEAARRTPAETLMIIAARSDLRKSLEDAPCYLAEDEIL